MEESSDKVDPIHQFGIHPIVDFGNIAGLHVTFTNSALFMFIAVAGIAALLILGTSRRAIVPGRVQALAEISYEFTANMLREVYHIEARVEKCSRDYDHVIVDGRAA